MYEDAPGTMVSRLLQVPQYVVLTASEVMFSVTGLGFAYSQVSNSLFRFFLLLLLLLLLFMELKSSQMNYSKNDLSKIFGNLRKMLGNLPENLRNLIQRYLCNTFLLGDTKILMSCLTLYLTNSLD